MPVTVYLGAVAVIAAIPLLWWSLAGSRRSNPLARANLGVSLRGPIGGVGGARGAGGHSFARTLLGHLPISGTIPALEKKAARAGLGSKWSTDRLLVLKVVLAGGVVLVGGAWVTTTRSALDLLLVACGAVLAFMLPDLQISGKANERQRRIERELPDLLDRLTISIEAGLGFDSALARVVSNGQGPAYDEFRWVLQDMQLGLPRDAALEALGNRTTIQDLRIFVGAVTQSGKYGLPLANVMRVQAAELREKRKTRAQEQAMKVPVKITIPLICCILPSLFMVILGPGIIRIAHNGLFG